MRATVNARLAGCLAIAVLTALAACDAEEEEDLRAGAGAGKGSSSGGATGAAGGATSNQAGKDFYVQQVHPFLQAGCGGCHGAGGEGPTWLTPADAGASYTQLFNVGYVVQSSRIVMKGAHAGSTTNVLSAAQVATYNQWVAQEEQARGGKAPASVLERFGTCLDSAKFDAIQFEKLRTTRRTNNNNANTVTPWNENANNCTGCDQAPCTMCHTDGGGGFKMAVGSTLVPKSNTLDETKTNLLYLTKYIAVGPTGEPVASDMVLRKADATKRDKAYTHPMFTLSPEMQAAIKAFTDDAIAKYKAGSCGK